MSKRIEVEVQDRPPSRASISGAARRARRRRDYGPGQHGQRRKEQDLRLRPAAAAKQKLKGYYGNMTEKAVPPAL